MAEEGRHDGGEDSLGDRGTSFDAVATVGEDLWLGDRGESGVLAGGSASSTRVGGLLTGQLGWAATGRDDLEDSSPLPPG